MLFERASGFEDLSKIGSEGDEFALDTILLLGEVESHSCCMIWQQAEQYICCFILSCIYFKGMGVVRLYLSSRKMPSV
jgi:hypothetical protein